MGGVAHERQAALVVVPRLCDPVADIGLVDLSALRNPHERRTRGLGKTGRLCLDDGQALGIAELVLRLISPRHGQVENPALRVVGAIRHAGNRLKGVEGALAKRQKAGGEFRAHVSSLLGIAIAYGQVHMPDRERRGSRLLGRTHCDPTDFGASAISTYHKSARSGGAVGEFSSRALSMLAEFDLAQVLAVLDVDTLAAQFSHLAPGHSQTFLVGYACKHVARLAVDDGIVATCLDRNGRIA